MAENPDHGSGDNEKARFDAASEDGSKAVISNLPMVVAPKLGAGEDDAIDEEIGEAAKDTGGPAAHGQPSAQSSRFLMLAATVAFAAAFGSFIGSVSGSGMVSFLSPATPASNVQTTTDAMRQTKLELAELSTIKANLDAASHSTTTQFAKLSDRLDKLDQRSASTETTGSITSASAVPAPTLTAAPKNNDRILQDWIVQDVQRGRALLQSRYGAMFDVGEGSMLPGVGRIDSIRRQDGQWLVLTERGTITSGR
ncbi:MAG: hypothetical protein WA652_15000 [Xanthobacteraceae bacterium]